MADAATYAGITDRSKLINLALDHYVKRMAARRLAALGGTMPDLRVPTRSASRHLDDTSPAREAARALGALGGTMPDLQIGPRRQGASSEVPMVADDEAPYRARNDEETDTDA